MGAGKTSVLAEASDLLTRRKQAHAAIDLDAFGMARLPSGNPTDVVMYDNLRSVCQNYAALGVQRLMVARAIESRDQLELCRKTVSATNVTVCRLTCDIETMRRRVEMREPGISQRECVARVADLNHILDRAGLEHFTVCNEGRPLTDVALEVLIQAGWIAG